MDNSTFCFVSLRDSDIVTDEITLIPLFRAPNKNKRKRNSVNKKNVIKIRVRAACSQDLDGYIFASETMFNN